jgi:uncharacterized membrane protein YdjX (TVP38/TMEM64 family)
MKIVRTKRNKQRPVADEDWKPAPKRQQILGWVILLAATALLLAVMAMLFRPLTRLASDPKKMRLFVRSRGGMGFAAFLGIQILQGFLPIPLELTTIAGGYIFGKVQGCAIAVCAVLISTSVIFMATKIFGGRLVDLFIPPQRRKKVRWFRNEKVRDTVTVLIFLIPGTPKRLFVFTAGLVPQDFKRFLFLSTAARVPALLICSFGGGALGNGDYHLGVALLVTAALLAAGGFAVYRSLVRQKEISPAQDSKKLPK